MNRFLKIFVTLVFLLPTIVYANMDNGGYCNGITQIIPTSAGDWNPGDASNAGAWPDGVDDVDVESFMFQTYPGCIFNLLWKQKQGDTTEGYFKQGWLFKQGNGTSKTATGFATIDLDSKTL